MSRPIPVPDEQSAPFWAASARRQLTLAECSACGATILPPSATCEACGSTEPAWRFVPVDGRGVVRSWTVVRQSFLPGFDADLPFALVDVELTDHPHVRLIGRLLDGVDAPLTLGAAVVAAFEDLSDGTSVPAFRLVP